MLKKKKDSPALSSVSLNGDELFYNNILNSMSNGVIALDYEGKIITYNDSATNILGISRERALGKYYPEVFFANAGNDEFNDVLINVIVNHESYLYKEIFFIKEDQTKVPLGITSSLLRDETGHDYGVVTVISDLSEVKKSKFLEDTLTRYVTKQVVDVIMKNPDSIVLDGEETEATILFTDIRDFTNIAEKTPPKELVNILRDYFTSMVNVSFDYNGTVDKFIGDSIMVIFGAPQPLPDHAERAVKAALEMQKEIVTLNSSFAAKGFPEIRMGIGICSGKVVVGNVGSQQRLEYTAIGDSVNLASRLEGINKIYGTKIVIGKSTFDAVEDKVFARQLDLIKVKGKDIPVEIYEVIDIKS